MSERNADQPSSPSDFTSGFADTSFEPAESAELEPADKARRTLEQEIHALEEHIQESSRTLHSFKSRYNCLAVVNCLPAEVLLQVFSWYISAMQRRLGVPVRTPHDPDDLSWLTITHVCQYWREVALNAPSLWTKLRITERGTSASLVDAFYTRARAVPVHVEAFHLSQLQLRTLQRVGEEVVRTKTLVLTLSSLPLYIVAERVPSSAPLLEHLHISDEITGHRNPYEHSRIPDSLLGMYMPVLQGLSTTSYYIDWRTFSFPRTLRHLSINSAFSLDKYIADYTDIVEALRPLIQLEHLNLVDVFATPPDVTMEIKIPLLALPRLQNINVGGSPIHAACFLLYCKLHPSLQVSLEFWAFHRDNGPTRLLRPLSYVLDKHISMDSNTRFTVKTLAFGCLYLKFHAGVIEDPDKCAKASSSAYFRMSLIRSRTVQSEFFKHVLPALPLQNVKVLTFEDDVRPLRSMSGWPEMLHVMQDIEYLNITVRYGKRDPNVIVSLLSLKSAATGDSHPGPFLMPRLKSIRLSVDFRPRGEHDNYGFTAALRNVLKERDAAGSKIQDLELRDCVNMDKGDAADLEEVVRVTWDGDVSAVELEPEVDSDTDDEL